jgi:MFS family permease
VTAGPGTRRTSPSDVPASSRRLLAVLGALYVSQGLAIGFLLTAVVTILRDSGAELWRLSLVNVLGLVWLAKILWGPVVDRFGARRFGHYRSWLLVVQPALALGIAALAWTDPLADFWWVFAALALLAVGLGFQDVAVDASLARTVSADRRGLGNGLQVGGYLLGTVLGSGVLVVYDQVGWPAAVLVLAFVVAGVWVLVLASRDLTVAAPEPTDRRPGVRDMAAVLGSRRARRWVGVLAAAAVSTLGVQIVNPMLVDAGWSATRIGLGVYVTTNLVAALGGLVTGFLVGRYGRRRVLVVALAGKAMAVLGLLPLAAGVAPLVPTLAAVSLVSATSAAMLAVSCTISMDLVRARTPGSDFTALYSAMFLFGLVAGTAGLVLANFVGYVPVVVAAAALGAVSVAVVGTTYREPVPAAAGGS